MSGVIDLARAAETTLAAEKRCELSDIVIKESGEPMVEVPTTLFHPYYLTEIGMGPKIAHLRRTVLGMLVDADQQAQAEGYSIRLYDGYRDNKLQDVLFWYYLARYTAPRLGFGEQFKGLCARYEVELKLSNLGGTLGSDLIRANTRYVAFPSEDPTRPANHRTGGSADVWLYRDEQPCDLGVVFDYMEPEAGAFYHLRPGSRDWPTGAPESEVARNRELLLRFMLGSGFTVYPEEIWHFDFGNQRHARIIGGPARYGAADHLMKA